ncbi:MAG: S8 family peptidase [Woeseiaceae bacterium]
MYRNVISIALLSLSFAGDLAAAPDADQDILVTFRNDGASTVSGAIRAPYRARKRYLIAAGAQRDADAIADEFALQEVDHWPIRSLGIYCFVYRVSEGADRLSIIDRLRADNRVESVQPLQEFETGTDYATTYNDTYANFQHGLDMLGIAGAHQISRGEDVRVAIIDSFADRSHEDLRGQIRSLKDFSTDDRPAENEHGTAVASVIGANANNSIGIVGIAPEASLELLVACWAAENRQGAVCDSFTLAKALDTLAGDPPQVLNMSLSGPSDPLLARLVDHLLSQNVVIVAADTALPGEESGFPASVPGVIGAGNSHQHPEASIRLSRSVFAPGSQIMVAVPSNEYDFRSGSSLAAAHVTGVVALFLAVSPEHTAEEIRKLLQNSQASTASGLVSVDACRLMNGAQHATNCSSSVEISESKVDAKAQ